MRNLRRHVKLLLALTLALALIGLMSWASLPSYSLSQLTSSNLIDKGNFSNLVRQSVPTPTRPDQATQARVNEAYGKLPLSFEANEGQTDAQVKFLSRGSGYSLFLTANEAVLALSRPAA